MKEHNMKYLLVFIIAILIVTPIIIASYQDNKFEVTIDLAALKGYTLAWAVLNIPGAEAPTPTIVESGDVLRIVFDLPDRAPRVVAGAGSLVAPTLTVLLVDYNSGEKLQVVITSAYLLNKTRGISSPMEVVNILSQDPLAAFRGVSLRLEPGTLAELQALGLAWKEQGVPGGTLGAKEGRVVAPSCGGGLEISPGIIFVVNTSDPVASQPTPEWFRERFIQLNNLGPDFYWERLRDRLAAGVYYVSTSLDLNDAINDIAYWAFGPGPYENRNGVSLISMEAFVGVNQWDDSLSGIVYSGPILFFQYRVDNQVDTDDSVSSLAIVVSLMGMSSINTVSGMLFAGDFIITSNTANMSVSHYTDLHPAVDTTKYFYYQGVITSPGDYLIVAWDRLGTVNCGGETYWLIKPRVIVTPLYDVSLDFGSLTVTDSPLDSPDYLAGPGVSMLLDDYQYNPNTYHEDGYEIYEFTVVTTSGTGDMEYDAVVGGPLYYFLEILLSPSRSSGAFESTVRQLASILLDTGFIAARTGASGAVVTLLLAEDEQPSGWYSIDMLNLVPRSLHGVEGIDYLTWSGVEITISEAWNPPPCGPAVCPTTPGNQTTP